MKAAAQCKDCCMKKAEGLLQEQGLNEKEKANVLAEIRDILYHSDENESAPYLMSQAMKVVEGIIQTEDMFEAEKRQFNQLMLHLEDYIYNKIQNAKNQLLAALKYALTGNYIDFGAMESVEEEKLLQLLDDEAHVQIEGDTYQHLENELQHAKKLVYITDNAGEIVMDKICIRILHELYPELQIQVIVRGAPALNDATMEDAREIGLTELVSVITNGSAIPGTPLHHISEEARTTIEEADLCIAKGQGNFETLYGCGLNIYYLFLCKCELFVEKFGVAQFTGILKNERMESEK